MDCLSGSGRWFRICCIANVVNIISTIHRGFDIFPGLRNKAVRCFFANSRASMLVIPDLASLPIFEGKMDKLIENMLLVLIDVKYIRLIQTGQIAVCLRHAKQELTAVSILFVEIVVYLFIINECDFLVAVGGNMNVHQPSWGLCIQFGVVPVTVFGCFRVSIILDVESRFA